MHTSSVVIVGASGSLGLAVCKAALAAGWSILGISRRPGEVLKEIGADRVHVFQADCDDPESVVRAFAKAKRLARNCVGAVNCAGISIRRPLSLLTLSEYRRVQAVNVEACLLAMQCEYDLLKKRGGVIVNTGSLASLRANRWNEAAYVAAKHALLGLTQAAAVEYGAKNVRVNIVLPSVFVHCEGSKAKPRTSFRLSDTVRLATKAPLGRLPDASEVARVALWLIQGCPACVTGTAIAVDSGLSCT